MFFDRQPNQHEVELPQEVAAVFQAYRESLPDFEGSPEFMPKLWEQIESQRKVTYSLRRLTNVFVTASAALCMVCAAALWVPPTGSSASSNPSNTYVEVLADASTAEAVVDSSNTI